jgi:hypothetical protein
MSAIAHGWRPSGSAAKIPVKVAKEFHSADAGHKYGAGMHGGKGKSYPKHNYADGGRYNTALAIARKHSRPKYQWGGGTSSPGMHLPLASPAATGAPQGGAGLPQQQPQPQWQQFQPPQLPFQPGQWRERIADWRKQHQPQSPQFPLQPPPSTAGYQQQLDQLLQQQASQNQGVTPGIGPQWSMPGVTSGQANPWQSGFQPYRWARGGRTGYALGGGDDGSDSFDPSQPPRDWYPTEHKPQEGDFITDWGRRAMPAVTAPPLDDADKLREMLRQRGRELRGYRNGGRESFDSRWQSANWPLMPQQYGIRNWNRDLDSRLAERAANLRQSMTPTTFDDRFQVPDQMDWRKPDGYDIGGGLPFHPEPSFNERWINRGLRGAASGAIPRGGATFDERFKGDDPLDRYNQQQIQKGMQQGMQEGGTPLPRPDPREGAADVRASYDDLRSTPPVTIAEDLVGRLSSAKGMDNALREAIRNRASQTIHRYPNVSDPVSAYLRGRHYQDGGGTDDLPDVGPPLIDPGPQISGGYSPTTNRYVNAASRVLGDQAADIMTLGPLRRFVTSHMDAARTQPGSEEAHEAYGDVGAATAGLGMSMMGEKGGDPAQVNMMIGPYGAHMLRQQRRALGENEPIHPVIGEEVKARTENIHPALRDIVRNWEVDKRDAQARAALEMQQGATFPAQRSPEPLFRGEGRRTDFARPPGTMQEAQENFARVMRNPETAPTTQGQAAVERATMADPARGGQYYSDKDIFPTSGWFRGREGAVKKEISDLGAGLRPTGRVTDMSHPGYGLPTYKLEHPAGDLHKAYDVPHVIVDRHGTILPPKADGGYDQNSGQMYVRSPSDVKTVLHEFQHAIQEKEGFAQGTNPQDAAKRREFGQELYPIEDPNGNLTHVIRPSWQAASDAAALKGIPRIRVEARFGPNPTADPEFRANIAAETAYRRAAGENESFNVEKRRAKGYRYQLHPEHTADVPPGLEYSAAARPRPRSQIAIHEEKPTPEEMVEHLTEGRQPHWLPPRETPESTKLPWRRYPKINEEEEAKGGRIRFQFGGGYKFKSNFNPERAAAFGLSRQSGMLHSSVPGRTDKLNLDVPSGSYVIPADITSGLGQGNSLAGGKVLDTMFNKGPYGMDIKRMHSGSPRMGGMRMSSMSKMSRLSQPGGSGSFGASTIKGFAPGGVPHDGQAIAPIVAAGGEYIVHPDAVRHLGGGDIDTGHDILDRFVKLQRDKHIETLKGLKPPKGSDEAKGKASGGSVKHSKAAVHYTNHGHEDSKCSLCRHFRSGHCAIVSGPISPEGWCNRFSKK